MNQNHKLSSVYFFATPKQVEQLKDHGYSIIRQVKTKVFEARVTNQEQFQEQAEKFDIYTTISEESSEVEVDSVIAGVDFSEVLSKLERL